MRCRNRLGSRAESALQGWRGYVRFGSNDEGRVPDVFVDRRADLVTIGERAVEQTSNGPDMAFFN